MAGANRDSDYDYPNRTAEWSRSDNNAAGSLAADLWLGMGYRFEPGGVQLGPWYGFVVSYQRLRMTDGYQSITTPAYGTPAIGPFPGLDSLYVATWIGPWLGGELIAPVSSRVRLSFFAAYVLAQVYGWADWNLRTDFAHPKSFDHIACGSGVLVRGEVRLGLGQGTEAVLALSGEGWNVGPGLDRTFGATGATAITQVNEIVGRSLSASLGLSRRVR